MTNEEKAQELASELYEYDVNKDNCEYYDCMRCALDMAEWKDSQYPHWNCQKDKDIYESTDALEHRFVCIMNDGKICEWQSVGDTTDDCTIEVCISPINNEKYDIDDILYWTELKIE